MSCYRDRKINESIESFEKYPAYVAHLKQFTSRKPHKIASPKQLCDIYIYIHLENSFCVTTIIISVPGVLLNDHPKIVRDFDYKNGICGFKQATPTLKSLENFLKKLQNKTRKS